MDIPNLKERFWMNMVVIVFLPHTFLIPCSLSVGLVALMVWRRGPSFVPP